MVTIEYGQCDLNFQNRLFIIRDKNCAKCIYIQMYLENRAQVRNNILRFKAIN